MRGFSRFLFGLLFVLVTIFLVTIFTLKTTILDRDYLLNRLVKNDVYTQAYNVIPELTKALVEQAEEKELTDGETPPLTGAQIGKIITDSMTPTVLREKTELFLTGFYGWIYGEGSAIPEISLADIKPKMETYAAAEMDVPIDVIRAGNSDFRVPEKIQIQPVPPLSIIRSIYANYNMAAIISLALCFISLAAAVLLSEDWAKRISHPGTPMIFTGIFLTINAGLIWGFFSAGNLLFNQVARSLSQSPATANVAHNFLNGIVNDIALKTLIFGLVIMVLGIILKIIGHFVKKKISLPIEEPKK